MVKSEELVRREMTDLRQRTGISSFTQPENLVAESPNVTRLREVLSIEHGCLVKPSVFVLLAYIFTVSGVGE